MTEAEKNRLYWRCRRGMLELDLLFHSFLRHGYEQLSPSGRRLFGELLEYPDQQLHEIFFGGSCPREREMEDVVEAIRNTAAY